MPVFVFVIICCYLFIFLCPAEIFLVYSPSYLSNVLSHLLPSLPNLSQGAYPFFLSLCCKLLSCSLAHNIFLCLHNSLLTVLMVISSHSAGLQLFTSLHSKSIKLGIGVEETDNYVLKCAAESSLSNGGTMCVHVICRCLWDQPDTVSTVYPYKTFQN